MNLLRGLFRRLAIVFVTMYARHIYKKGVEAAELRHKREGKTIYLASDTFRSDHLVTYNKQQFKAEKKVYGNSPRQLVTMNALRFGCYYHTADQFGKGGLSKRDIEIRRKAFVKERLIFSKLVR